ncbi:MAG: B12-binding domain-containing radical SAM protein [Candidatus Marinimicrobia bacterium]|nr:B12-binding domain-containing radical SAM protein [Candidatus Neomarinimicrobiota bacterium]
MSDVILVNTLQHDFQKGFYTLGNSRKNQPLDLALAAAVLAKEKLEVKIIDANLERFSHQKVARKVAQEKPKLVVINTASLDRWECPLPTIKEPRRLAAEIKKVFPQALLVVIGPHGTTTPDWLLQQCPQIDLLVRGEPEFTLQEISQNLPLTEKAKKKILGISYFQQGKIVHQPPRPYLEKLDTLPMPAYHLLPMKKYGPMSDHFGGDHFEGATHPFSIILTSRGCPGLCLFCYKNMYQDKKSFRFRSPKKVVDEIELLIKKFGVRAIYLQDLSFCIDPKRVLAICQEINQRKLKFTWGCEARFDSVNPQTLQAMKKAGCAFINFGLESGSEKILFLCQKNIPLKVIEKAVADCRQTQIAVGCFKLTGLPGETRKTFITTLEYMVKNKIFIPYPFPLSLPIPYPSTKLHQIAEKQFGQKITWENAPDCAGRVGTDFFKKVTLEEIQRLAYQYKLKQEGKKKNKHYFRLLALEKMAKFKSLSKRANIVKRDE